MKKILFFGVTGMLGNQVLRVFSQINKFKIIATYRNKKDLKILKQNFKNLKKIKFVKFDAENYNFPSLKKIIGNNDIIINNIGIIKPHIDEKSTNSILRAIKVNAVFPNNISEVIKNKSTRLYQIATDCVYNGKGNKYCENSDHNPTDVYGKTKSLGEVSQRNVFNLRVSIIGLETKGYLSLVSWYLKNKNQTINGFVDHKWNGVTTNTFANLLKTIIIKNINLPNKIHILPKNILTKYSLLKLFKLRFKGNGKIRKIKSSNSINRVLKTNFHSMNSKIWKLSSYKRILTIKEMINEI